MKTRRLYKAVKTDQPGSLKFVCIDSPKAWPIYLGKSDFPKGKVPKIGDKLTFKRYTNRYTTTWVPAVR